MTKIDAKGHVSSADNQEAVRPTGGKDGFARVVRYFRSKVCVVSEFGYSARQSLEPNILKIFCVASGIGLFSSVSVAEVLQFSFEEGEIPSGWTGSVYGMRPDGNSPTVTPEESRSGSRSMRTYLNRLTSTTSFRTEVSLNQTCDVFCLDSHRGADTQDYWIGFSLRVKGPHPQDAQYRYQWIAQVHSSPPPGETWDWYGNAWPLLIGLLPDSDTTGSFKVLVGGGGKTGYIPSDSPDYLKVLAYGGDIGRYTVDTWHDFVIHVKYSPDEHGFFRLWLDGVKEIDVTGPIEHVGNGTPYLKFGLYADWKDRTIVDPVVDKTVYHDDIKIAWGPGAGYDSVAPGKSNLVAPAGLRVLED